MTLLPFCCLLCLFVWPEGPAGLHKVLRVSGRIYSGSEPHGEDGFRSLARLGVKVVVSVDGARPDVATAKKYGLRYVHIPVGYDGVSRDAAAALTRLVRELDGPFYVHCHHGQHRGPAAAAVACVASGAMTNAGAVEILKRAGTSQDYTGLWRDVRGFVPPAPDAKLPELVEVARVESLAAAMATIDRHFDHLKACRQATWQAPPAHPDLVPAQEALLLREGLRESARHLGAGYDQPFRDWLGQAERTAHDLERALRSADRDAATRHFGELKQSCDRCHRQYRNDTR